MPDIEKCQNESCKFKLKCYRFTSKPYDFQHYTDFTPTDSGCEYFMDNGLTEAGTW